ncbi:glycosyltransferase involved in cell wall biosynthesis [Sphingomonas kaistensis]|uniref:Glycosyltransferase involved in cell wall biosynthesis n=1 Tax=Sphingomonas kaistensis TaxID=298708 RepID=A0A7X6BFH4_9SPHN|nr:glycosyltransferase involved in cell wall biosynthesis [Sphingomonas kaistensis]
MNADFLPPAADKALLLCDLTQSWSAVGGGVGTYLRAKRAHIIANTPHTHLMILPGSSDAIEESDGGRAITVWLKSPSVPFSPNYRLLLRNGAVRKALARYRPDVIECQDAYNLPWAAIRHRRDHPGTALVAGYMTDFPNVYVERPVSKAVGSAIGSRVGKLCYDYCGKLYRQFDCVYALSEAGGGHLLRALGVEDVQILPLGVDLADFGPDRRDPELRRSLGLSDDQPLLIYVGRMDIEKRPDIIVEAFRTLPESLGAKIVLLGQGPQKDEFEALGDPRIITPGFVTDRPTLARYLASADLYVSAMPNETFGVSVIEAQASGLPVVGVNGGAMPERVLPGMGLLGPIANVRAMAANIQAVLASDHRAMGERGRAYVSGEYSWPHSMEKLFGTIIPHALARAATRRLPGVVPAGSLVEA